MFTDIIKQAQDTIYTYKQILAAAVNKHARKIAEEEIEKNLEIIIKYEALNKSLKPSFIPTFVNCKHSIYTEDCPECMQQERDTQEITLVNLFPKAELRINTAYE